jgi:hypothetical protein
MGRPAPFIICLLMVDSLAYMPCSEQQHRRIILPRASLLAPRLDDQATNVIHQLLANNSLSLTIVPGDT